MSDLAKVLRTGRRIVFFGGAGVSTESGIPDFRSSTGLYTTHAGGDAPPEYLLSRTCFDREPRDFYDFYRGHLLHPEARPNAAHLALARLEEDGRLAAIVTQNIDGLHQAAGSRRVFELHGSVHRNTCLRCGKRFPLAHILATAGVVPSCTACGGTIKPDVVLYEEPLDPEVVEGAITAIEESDVLIVGGTSLNVYPAAGLIRYHRGPQLVLINKSATPFDSSATLVLHAALGEVLPSAVASALA